MYRLICLAIITSAAVGCGSGEVELDVSMTGDSTEASSGSRIDTVIAPPVHDTIVQPSTTLPHNNDTSATTGGSQLPMNRPIVTVAEQVRIDEWLIAYADSLNDYGDPEGTMYAGGTPLFNESSGKPISKYEYIVARHPERPWDKPLPAKQ